MVEETGRTKSLPLRWGASHRAGFCAGISNGSFTMRKFIKYFAIYKLVRRFMRRRA
tara:strand:+ start:2032 stop:2199 length:168 start_codon:yes stop_codon:yes gene_type:complete